MRNELAVIGSIVKKGKRIIIPFQLKQHILQQLLSNHMGIEKVMLLVCVSVYLLAMNADIEITSKHNCVKKNNTA